MAANGFERSTPSQVRPLECVTRTLILDRGIDMRFLAGAVFVLGVAVSTISSQSWVPSVPRAWDDEAVRTMELPLAGLGVRAHHVSSEYYYQIPTLRIPT